MGGLDHNLLAIELKRYLEELVDKDNGLSDLDKTLEYTKPAEGRQAYQYQYGLALCFLPELKLHWFRDGKALE